MTVNFSNSSSSLNPLPPQVIPASTAAGVDLPASTSALHDISSIASAKDFASARALSLPERLCAQARQSELLRLLGRADTPLADLQASVASVFLGTPCRHRDGLTTLRGQMISAAEKDGALAPAIAVDAQLKSALLDLLVSRLPKDDIGPALEQGMKALEQRMSRRACSASDYETQARQLLDQCQASVAARDATIGEAGARRLEPGEAGAPAPSQHAYFQRIYLSYVRGMVDEERLTHPADGSVSENAKDKIDSLVDKLLHMNPSSDQVTAHRMADLRAWLQQALAAQAPLPSGLADRLLAQYDQCVADWRQRAQQSAIFRQQVKDWGEAQACLVSDLNQLSRSGDAQEFEADVWRHLNDCFQREVADCSRRVHFREVCSIQPLQSAVDNAVSRALQKVAQPEAAKAALRRAASRFIHEVHGDALAHAAAPSVPGFMEVLKAPDVHGLEHAMYAYVCEMLMPDLALGRSLNFDNKHEPLRHALDRAIEIMGAQEMAPAAREALRQVFERIDVHFPRVH